MFSYSHSLSYVYKLNRNRKVWLKFGFDRMLNVLEKIGNPQDSLKTIHIAGTKGKGSTLAFFSSILRQKFKVGSFTSPSLVNATERISIDGSLIPPHSFSLIVDRLKEIYSSIEEENVPSTFETFTIISFIYFLEKQVDIALYEVGLGGRLDATNIIRHPLVSIITEISYDHQKTLGNTLREIATEKAGIIKKGTPLVIAKQEKEALETIVNKARKKRIDYFEYGKDYFITNVKEYEKGTIFDFHSPSLTKNFEKLFVPMMGKHQAENAASAIQAALLLKEKGCNLDESDIRNGLSKTFWPGRLEIASKIPLIVLDGAHNKASAEALAHLLMKVFDKKIVFLFSMLKDKNIEDTLSVLAPIGERFVLTEVPHSSSRRLTVDKLNHIAERYISKDRIVVEKNPVRAFYTARRNIKEDELLCVTGSLYLVGYIRKLMNYFIFSKNLL